MGERLRFGHRCSLNVAACEWGGASEMAKTRTLDYINIIGDRVDFSAPPYNDGLGLGGITMSSSI